MAVEAELQTQYRDDGLSLCPFVCVDSVSMDCLEERVCAWTSLAEKVTEVRTTCSTPALCRISMTSRQDSISVIFLSARILCWTNYENKICELLVRLEFTHMIYYTRFRFDGPAKSNMFFWCHGKIRYSASNWFGVMALANFKSPL